LSIRKATKADVPVILEMIRGLAEYEKALNEVEATEETLAATLFSASPAAFAEIIEHEGLAVGFAIWFLNYSTWQAKYGLYLEDLYVLPECRGHGYGKQMLVHLAQTCIDNDYGRFQWWVLDWNEPSIEFYKAHGAVAMDEWTVFRVAGENLKKLADTKL
jgi:GNAT superfamily N-acetyltransferase